MTEKLNEKMFKTNIDGLNENKLKEITQLNWNNLELIYRKSRDSHNPEEIWKKIEGVSDTIVIVKANNKIFGGYSSVEWKRSGHIKDNKAFQFSYDLGKKFYIKPNKVNAAHYALENSIRCGEIRIIVNNNECCYFGNSFNLGKYECEDICGEKFGGRYHSDEIEIYKIIH